jgi:hypothetical protein
MLVFRQMEARCLSVTLISTCYSTRCHYLEDHRRHTGCRKNLWSHHYCCSTRAIQKVRRTLQYFRRMIGNTIEGWSCCKLRSDSDMLRVWFSSSPFVLSQCGVKSVATLHVCTKKCINFQFCRNFCKLPNTIISNEEFVKKYSQWRNTEDEEICAC